MKSGNNTKPNEKFNRDTEIVQRNQTEIQWMNEIQWMKNTMNEMKNCRRERAPVVE